MTSNNHKLVIIDKKQMYPSIQFLRFFAAMLVVIMHATEAISLRITSHLQTGFWDNGSAGVDIFFVISGFVMTVSTSLYPTHLREKLAYALLFFKRRLVRIVPLYWFYTTLKIIFVLLMPALALRSVIDLNHVLNSFLFIPSKSPWGLTQPILPVGFTLNFEMFFYLVFALSIAFGLPRFLWCLFVFVLIFAMGKSYTESVALNFYSQSIIFEFILGILVAKIYTRYKNPPILLGLVAIIIGFIIIFYIKWPDGVDRFLIWGFGAMLTVIGFLICEQIQVLNVFFDKCKLFGDASYSIYLSHTFVVPAVVSGFNFLGFDDVFLITSICCIIVVICSFISYFFIEKPLGKMAATFLLKKS